MGSFSSMRLVVFVALAVGTGGCASRRPNQTATDAVDDAEQAAIRVERGRPNRFIDRVGSVAGTPNKLALWDRRADNHDVSRETEEQLIEYMVENDLGSVLVRVNQYDPCGEWRRLAANKRVGAGWRYTVGTLSMLEYTLLPGRILGGDWYNPWTDTINLYSDLSPLALARAAYAKDVHRRRFPGGYAAINDLPVAGMWHETIANRDVLDYLRAHDTDAQREEANQILYPDFGGSLGADAIGFVPIPYVAAIGRLAGAAVGQAANGVRRGVRRLVRPREEPASSETAADVPADVDESAVH